MEGEVTISVDSYNRLRDENKRLREQVSQYCKERDEICKDNKVRVLIYNYDDDEDELVVDELVNFDDVKVEVEEHFGHVIENQHNEIEKLKMYLHDCETSDNDEIRCLREKNLSLVLEIESLKRRGLWKRILNK